MVIRIDSIPRHIQKQIAEKMEFSDFKKFRESSGHARGLGERVKPTMNVGGVTISQTDVTVRVGIGFLSFFRKPILLSNAKIHLNCPRFCSPNIGFNECITDERCIQLIRDVEQGRFTGRRMHSVGQSYLESINIDIFIRLIEVLGITKIDCGDLNNPLIKIPILHNIHFCFSYDSVPDDDLLALRLPKITLTPGIPYKASTLNQIFKEWANNQRVIISIELCGRFYTAKLKTDTLFCDLSYSVLWSPETGDPSLIANLTPEEREFAYRSYCYSLNNGSNNLFIFVHGSSLSAREVSNSEKELRNFKNIVPRLKSILR